MTAESVRERVTLARAKALGNPHMTPDHPMWGHQLAVTQAEFAALQPGDYLGEREGHGGLFICTDTSWVPLVDNAARQAAEQMRERCAQEIEKVLSHPTDWASKEMLSAAIRALPLEEGER